ncbi:MAG: DNA replication/repair protein RecF [Paracoccus sp. (in: a-proteobacteria)]|nr:DNA replication/repair protein RecF [Paracoccus sp. (in: a-proteobacteria)]
MRITRLSLAQFRSWRRLDLSPGAAPVAFYGPNGSGKTNILEALSMLSPGRGLRGAAPEQQARLDAGAGWRVRAEIGGQEVETGAAPGARREVLIEDKPAPQVALGRLLRVIWLVPAMDRLWSDAPETRRRFVDRIALSFTPGHADAVLSYDKAMRERNRLLRDEISDPGWYGALEHQMGISGGQITQNRLDALARITSFASDDRDFPAPRLSLLPGEGFADDPEPGSITARLAEMRRRDLAAGRSLTGPHRADLGAHWGEAGIEAALSSTGEQKALLLSVMLANARAIAAENPVLLLDEVAAHLDADRRAALYAMLAETGAQVFMTGTGPELFDQLDGALFAVSRVGGESRLAPG